MSRPSIYTGPSLSDRTIRLLFICPSPDSQRRIECYCHPFDIEATPPYEALSYVWGVDDPTTKVAILCNGEEITIGAALASALRRLRLADRERVLWADAVCINQSDNDEKSLQVPMMGSIYSLAKRVVVWLGHGNSHQIREATQCVRIVGKACREHEASSKVFRKYEALVLAGDTVSPAVCAALKELYDRAWFSRVWCIQEIKLARDAIVLWGEQEVSWSDVGLTAWWISNNIALVSSLGQVSKDYLNALVMYAPSPYQMKLLPALYLYRTFEATDPRDKVYGLLSLVEPEEEVKVLELDYNKNAGEVYADTVLSTIRLYSRLTALCYVAHPPDYDEADGIKSWAPRWGKLSWTTMTIYFSEPDNPWSACRGHLVERVDNHHITLEQLQLKGILYDTVTAIHTIMTDDNLRSPENLHGIHPFLDAQRDVISSAVLTSDNAYKEQQWCKLARTLSAGWLFYGERVSNSDRDAQETFYDAFAAMMQDLYHRTSRHFVPESSDAQIPAYEQYQDVAYNVCRHRRVFKLQDGSYGLGPQCMRAGDIVVVLYGGATPYVLRPKRHQYLFMGEAYVDEIMRGELVDEVETERRPEQDFCIV